LEFQRSDATVVVELVRRVADTADPGEHGDGVQVVIEAPRRGWPGRLVDDGLPEQARIAVTKSNVDSARARRQPDRREPELCAESVAHLVAAVVALAGLDSLTRGSACPVGSSRQ